MFDNSAYLFALAGLAIPVVIHFLSRKEGKIIKLGSVRHVVETSTQQFKGIKLNEIFLLTLRCAMVVLFSLLLSGLRCSSQDKEKWTLVERGLEGIPQLHAILDSLRNDGYAMHLLANGFPDLSDSSKHSAEINYGQLVEDLKWKNLSDAIVFSRNNINYFKGSRPALPANVRWISQPLPPTDFPIQAIRFSRDSVSLRMGHTASDKTYFTTNRISIEASPMPITPEGTIKVALVHDAAFNDDSKIIKAVLRAIEKTIPVKISLIETDPLHPPSKADWCLWFSTQKAGNLSSKYFLRIADQISSELIVQENPNQWIITRRLNQETALQYHLATQLATLLLPETNLQRIITDHDRRMVSDSLAWASVEGAKKMEASIHQRPADLYLIMLLIALLIMERVIAYKKNQ